MDSPTLTTKKTEMPSDGKKHGENKIPDTLPKATVDYACVASPVTGDCVPLLNEGCGHTPCCPTCCLATYG